MMAIDGTYELEFDIQGAKQSGRGILKADGNSLSGAVVDDKGVETPFDGGTVDGNSFSFTVVNASGPAGPVTFTCTGVVDGDDISGEMQMPGFGFKFSGRRV